MVYRVVWEGVWGRTEFNMAAEVIGYPNKQEEPEAPTARLSPSAPEATSTRHSPSAELAATSVDLSASPSAEEVRVT